ncbi:hypothetical protein [Parafrankia sp. EUN1f]|uniref:hypothetical protein n=1 Tax=Parafrankia sp. EUN1f TaxID=102897 RepID=UPI0001C45999|nr:hypothetical protein [Parafrankia sp. EUN1f]EFC86480.1 hypothetical protein FrEUN1fDRAFT_0375 [Parafrankia sp. EUN1f]
MPYLNIVGAPGTAGAIFYVPAWRTTRDVDLPDVVRRALAEDPTVTRVEILSDSYGLTETVTRDGER